MINSQDFGDDYGAEFFGDPSDNLIIEGDNLSVMDTLLDFYPARFKVIYLDPPYNTGKTRLYQDSYDSQSWLSFMKIRLQLCAELLSIDGLVFASMNDSELFRLGILMDDIFGKSNRLPIITWQNKYGKQNNSKSLSKDHEYILCYAKNIKKLQIRDLPRTSEMDARYKNHDNDPRGLWKSADFSVMSNEANDNFYPIVLPSGRIVMPPSGRVWVRSESDYKVLVADNRIWFGINGSSKPQMKLFLREVRSGSVPTSTWSYEEVGHTDSAKKEIKRMTDVSVHHFDSAKPKSLISRCINLVADKDDWILDPFAGSGTTGHAILEQNKKDGGNRKFVLIEIGMSRSLTVSRCHHAIVGDENSQGTGGGFSYIYNCSPSRFSDTLF